MGDRRHVIFDYGKAGKIYLYSHWNGYDLPERVAKALDTEQARNRWNDEPYLTRILIELLTEKDRGEPTGWGVYPTYQESQYTHDIIINMTNRNVQIGGLILPYEDYIQQEITS